MRAISSSDLEPIIADYKKNLAYDETHGADWREQFLKIAESVKKLALSLDRVDLKALAYCLERSREETDYGYLLQRLSRFQMVAVHEAEFLKHRSRSAPFEAAWQIQDLFESLNLRFSATANSEYGKNSLAVETLLRVANGAGDKMKAASACDWIKKVKRETKPEYMPSVFPIP